MMACVMTDDSARTRLLEEKQSLMAEDAGAAGDRGTVTLDQQSVGRLSRMDALQRQAMAQAASRRRQARLARIDAALRRIDSGEYGYCLDCGEDLPSDRLEADPTATLCVSCARG